MYVYSNIVKLSPVSNSQIPIMSFYPINIKFHEVSKWVFNQFWMSWSKKRYKNYYNENFYQN